VAERLHGNAMVSINAVTLHQAWWVLAWLTIWRWVKYSGKSWQQTQPH